MTCCSSLYAYEWIHAIASRERERERERDREKGLSKTRTYLGRPLATPVQTSCTAGVRCFFQTSFVPISTTTRQLQPWNGRGRRSPLLIAGAAAYSATLEHVPAREIIHGRAVLSGPPKNLWTLPLPDGAWPSGGDAWRRSATADLVSEPPSARGQVTSSS